ncbi:hypothetical protein BJX70DRAFT_397055 [Aspergillus crustosus]
MQARVATFQHEVHKLPTRWYSAYTTSQLGRLCTAHFHNLMKILARIQAKHKKLYTNLACKQIAYDLLKFSHWVENYDIQPRYFRRSLEQRLGYGELLYNSVRHVLFCLIYYLEQAQEAAAKLVGIRGIFSRGRELTKYIANIRDFMVELGPWSYAFLDYYLGMDETGLERLFALEDECREVLAFIRLVL